MRFTLHLRHEPLVELIDGAALQVGSVPCARCGSLKHITTNQDCIRVHQSGGRHGVALVSRNALEYVCCAVPRRQCHSCSRVAARSWKRGVGGEQESFGQQTLCVPMAFPSSRPSATVC